MAEYIEMKERTMDEMITRFNDTVAEMKIEPKDKLELLGMITAIGYRHERVLSALRDCRNELCLKCGQYKTKHLGSCKGCRWELKKEAG